jgi:hypothetical protein
VYEGCHPPRRIAARDQIADLGGRRHALARSAIGAEDLQECGGICGRRSTQAGQQLETLLENYKLTVDLIITAAFDDRIVSQLHIDRMTTTAWERRVAAYAELDRLRTLSGKPEAPRNPILEIEREEHPTAPIGGGGGF